MLPVDDGSVTTPCSLLIRTLSVALLLAIAGCDRQSPEASSSDPTVDREAVPARLVVELIPIAPLVPRLRTHVAVDSHGNLYWVQEGVPTPDGGDLVFVMGASGVPQTIPGLGVPRLLAALGPDEARRGSGAIRSIAIGAGDELYVLFTGGRDRVPIWALARYAPNTNKVTIVADTKRLMDSSGFGASIDLARGSLVGNGRDLWLWLRHSDAASVSLIVPIHGGQEFEFHRLALKPPAPVKSGQLTSEMEDLAAGPGQLLYYIDRPRAMLWKIDGAGGFTPYQSLDGLSRDLTTPALDDTGRMCLLAGEGDPLVPLKFVAAGPLAPVGNAAVAWTPLAYPALLQIQVDDKGQSARSTIKHDDFSAPAALPVQDFHPRGLLLDPTTGTLITFDDSSGELLRLKVNRK